MSAYITDREGRRIAQGEGQPLSVGNGAASGGHQSVLTVAQPRVWTLDDPYLYRAVVLVRSGGRIVDSVGVRFGIRTRPDRQGQRDFF